MKINKNSNIYIVCYIIVMVVLVGSALAYTAMSLRDRQQENIDRDKMRQILAALHITVPKDSIKDEYNKVVAHSLVTDMAGTTVDADAFTVDVAAQVKKPDSERLLPVYVAEAAGETRYVVPVYGAGLWGPIWGYVAFDSDGSTIYGAYFDHQGETPGLGAEIAKPAFSDQFDGKKMFLDGRFIPVAVVKKGQKYTAGEYVDGVSGGTITSKGVSAMLHDCLLPYETFLKSLNQK